MHPEARATWVKDASRKSVADLIAEARNGAS